METKSMNAEQTQEAISLLEKRVDFNNRLNAFVRRFMKERGLGSFNPYHDDATEEMRETYRSILLEERWMPADVAKEYASSCAAVFGQAYSPAVNRYVLGELKRLRAHLAELESAQASGDEDLGWAKLTRDLSSNRMDLTFDEAPDEGTRRLLRANGFRWSPYRKAWTRQLTSAAESSLKKLAANVDKERTNEHMD